MNWKAVIIAFCGGVVAWGVHLAAARAFVAILPFFPGVIHLTGGEWDGWQGPGWIIERVWCFGTYEDCANFDGSPPFSIQPPVLAIVIVLWCAVSLLIGYLVARNRRPMPAQ